ncbi:MAG: hypothetical protein IPF59_14095 [Ignavibacteria bacterium]|nr:hypothetical protein [Ignavibacteria bacterium]
MFPSTTLGVTVDGLPAGVVVARLVCLMLNCSIRSLLSSHRGSYEAFTIPFSLSVLLGVTSVSAQLGGFRALALWSYRIGNLEHA